MRIIKGKQIIIILEINNLFFQTELIGEKLNKLNINRILKNKSFSFVLSFWHFFLLNK